jgi:leader peptidase (prepilin peptidase)/N-methyltransferase
VTAAAAAALALCAPDPLTLLGYCWVAGFGVVLGFVDVAVRRLPDRFTVPAYLGVLALVVADGRFDAVLSGAAVAGGYLLLVVISPAGMGLGDAKLALSLGTALGWLGWPVAIAGAAAGFLLGGLYGAALLIGGRAGRKDELPHGPFMLVGALAVVVARSLTG